MLAVQSAADDQSELFHGTLQAEEVRDSETGAAVPRNLR